LRVGKQAVTGVHILEMTKRIHINVLLTVCTALVGFGILTIAIRRGSS
jgi:hypothetical protein